MPARTIKSSQEVSYREVSSITPAKLYGSSKSFCLITINCLLLDRACV